MLNPLNLWLNHTSIMLNPLNYFHLVIHPFIVLNYHFKPMWIYSMNLLVNLFTQYCESIHTLLWIYSHIIVNLFIVLFMGLVNLFTHYCESIHRHKKINIWSCTSYLKLYSFIHSFIHSSIHPFIHSFHWITSSKSNHSHTSIPLNTSNNPNIQKQP